MKLTTEMVVSALPLDRTRYNVDRLIYEASTGAGYSADLDPEIIYDRLREMSAACLACAEYVQPFMRNGTNTKLKGATDGKEHPVP